MLSLWSSSEVSVSYARNDEFTRWSIGQRTSVLVSRWCFFVNKKCMLSTLSCRKGICVVFCFTTRLVAYWSWRVSLRNVVNTSVNWVPWAIARHKRGSIIIKEGVVDWLGSEAAEIWLRKGLDSYWVSEECSHRLWMRLSMRWRYYICAESSDETILKSDTVLSYDITKTENETLLIYPI